MTQQYRSPNPGRMHDALQRAGGNVRYSEYPGVGHNSWDKAYSEPGLVLWLLSQTLQPHKAAHESGQ